MLGGDKAKRSSLANQVITVPLSPHSIAEEGNEPGVAVDRFGLFVPPTTEENEDNKLFCLDIASYQREFTRHLGAGVAVNEKFICYSVRHGQIRLIGSTSGQIELLKAPGVNEPANPAANDTKMLLRDMQFSPVNPNLLGSVGGNGKVAIWSLGEPVPYAIQQGTVVPLPWQLALVMDSQEPEYTRIRWHTTDADIFFLLRREILEIWSFSSPTLPTGVLRTDDVITDACYSPLGTWIAACTAKGGISVWNAKTLALVGGAEDTETMQRVFWTRNDIGSEILVSVGKNYSVLKLWEVGFQIMEIAALVIEAGDLILNCAEIDQSGSFLVVCYTSEPPMGRHDDNGIFVVHIQKSAEPRFDYVSTFHVRFPIVSMSLVVPSLNGSEQDRLTIDQFDVVSVQIKPIQRFRFTAARTWRPQPLDIRSLARSRLRESPGERTEEGEVGQDVEGTPDEGKGGYDSGGAESSEASPTKSQSSPVQGAEQTPSNTEEWQSLEGDVRRTLFDSSNPAPEQAHEEQEEVVVDEVEEEDEEALQWAKKESTSVVVQRGDDEEGQAEEENADEEDEVDEEDGFCDSCCVENKQASSSSESSSEEEVSEVQPPSVSQVAKAFSMLSHEAASPTVIPGRVSPALPSLPPIPSPATTVASRPASPAITTPIVVPQVSIPTSVPSTSFSSTSSSSSATLSTSSSSSSSSSSASNNTRSHQQQPPVVIHSPQDKPRELSHRDRNRETREHVRDNDNDRSQKERAESNLLSRLDRMFTKHFQHVTTQMMKERSQRETEEKERLAVVLQEMKDSLPSLIRKELDAGANRRDPSEMVNKAVGTGLQRQLPKALEGTIQKELNKALTSIRTSVSAPSISPEVLQKSLDSSLHTLFSNPEYAQSLGPSAQDVADALTEPIQDCFKTCFSQMLLPAFEASTRVMFQQIHGTLQTHFSQMSEEKKQSASSEKVEHSMVELKKAVVTLAQVLDRMKTTTEAQVKRSQDYQVETIQMLEACQQKLDGVVENVSALAKASKAPPPPVVEEDPFVAIQRLLDTQKYNEAFVLALGQKNMELLVWLCSQLDSRRLLGADAAPVLTSAVVASLTQQLTFDLESDTNLKLAWLSAGISCLERYPDPAVGQHLPELLREVSSNLSTFAKAEGLDMGNPKTPIARSIKSAIVRARQLAGSA